MESQFTWFETLHPAVSGLVCLVVCYASLQVGYRFGRWHAGEAEKSGFEFGTIQGSLLGLLGLLLAFTYAYVSGRVEQRKTLIVEEANRLGTAFLRARLVPEPARSRLRHKLRNYAATRILSPEDLGSPERVEAALARASEHQAELWPALEAALANRTPTPIDALLVSAINDVLDIHAMRVAAFRDRLPQLILGLLLFASVAALGLTGYAGGLTNHRNFVFTNILVVMIGSVLYVIIDFDHSRVGLLRLSQRSLIETLEGMDAELRAEGVPSKEGRAPGTGRLDRKGPGPGPAFARRGSIVHPVCPVSQGYRVEGRQGSARQPNGVSRQSFPAFRTSWSENCTGTGLTAEASALSFLSEAEVAELADAPA